MSGIYEFMLALDDELRKTRYFQIITEQARQEGIREGRQELLQKQPITKLLEFGLSVEQIAGALNLSVEQVKQIATQLSN
jgi:predicted transposase/invertase (TIGR01784 family)